MMRLSVFSLMLLLACPFTVQAQHFTEYEGQEIKLGVHAKSGKFNAQKLKDAVQNNKNFGRLNGMKPRQNPYANNFDGKAMGKNSMQPKIKTDFGMKAPQNKYHDVQIMPQQKGLKNIGCFGTPNAGKC